MDLQELVQTYMESADFSLLDVRDGFIVADRLGFGGERDTRLIWIPPPSIQVKNFSELERKLLRDFEAIIPKYRNRKYSIIAYTLDGFSRDFRAEAGRLGVKLNVPVNFFDAPFKAEGLPHATKDSIKKLADPDIHRYRVSQPFSFLVDGEPVQEGEDLLYHLMTDFGHTESSILHVVVGPAGVGKSVFFNALFSSLYLEFSKSKKRREELQKVFPRPIPLTPEYLSERSSSIHRTDELINNFIRKEVDVPISPSTFEWMLVNGFASWLFDGVDELYARDEHFFDMVLDFMTRQNSKAQILICARDSLLTSCDTLGELLGSFSHGPQHPIRIYRVENWEHTSKRAFAWLKLKDHLPRIKDKTDPPEVLEFLECIGRSESLRSLSGIPFYCNLLIKEFKEGKLTEFPDDIALIEHTVSKMIEREKEKGRGLLVLEQFQPNGLNEWLETVAWGFYGGGFTGLRKLDIEEYAEAVLKPDLSREERDNAKTTLNQFPLFAPGSEAGVITFEHELIAEYLAGKYLLKYIKSKPTWVANSLDGRIDFANSLIARYMAKNLQQKEGIQFLIENLSNGTLTGRAFANFLQLLLLSTPIRDVIKSGGILLEGRDLSHVEFIQRDLGGLSFRNCDLANTLFRDCNLKETRLEGANLVGTRFENLSEDALKKAQFGNLERFQFVYVGKQRIDELRKANEWLQKVTGIIREIDQPCPTALQLRTLFLKFVYPDGTGRRNELPEIALTRGKRYPGAPTPDECVRSCRTFGYLQRPDQRGRTKRPQGDCYNDIVSFVRDRRLTTSMRQLLNSICRKTGCQHMPVSQPLGVND